MKVKTEKFTDQKQRVLIFEDDNSIRYVRLVLNEVRPVFESVLHAYNSTGIKPELDINDLSYLISTSNIESWLRGRIIKNTTLPKIGEFAMDKEAAKVLIQLPNYSALENATIKAKEETEKQIQMHRFQGKYHVFNDLIGFFIIEQGSLIFNDEVIEKQLDMYRVYIQTDQEKFYNDLVNTVSFLNQEVVAKDNDPMRWSVPSRLNDLFQFNNTIRRFEINPNYFRR